MTVALLLLLFLLPAGPWSGAASAQPPKPPPVRDGGAHIAARLVAESDRPAPGDSVTLAFEMKPDTGWHGYWANPGDAGVGMRVDWILPEGAAVSPLRHPVPGRLTIAGLMNYVYKGDYALLATLSLPAGIAPGTPLPIRARAEWLACTDTVCVPERAELALDLVAGSGVVDVERRARFDAWRKALPRPLGREATFAVADGKLRLAVPIPAHAPVRDAYFFPRTEGAIDYAAPQEVRRRDDRLIVEAVAGRAAPGLQALEGVLAIGEGRGLAIAARPGAVDPADWAAAAPLVSGGTERWPLVLLAFGGALLGGLLLNVMPCVFPIVSLKALGLARGGASEAAARREALAYAAGAVLTCLALGGLLLALRAGGAAVGWAFQLQDPRIILLLLVLVSAIALNLAGLFELGRIAGGDGLAGQGGAAGAFWTGALAAFVGTPCTGPFMGAALGAALVLPWAPSLAIFAGLGLGMALPFLLIGHVPALRRLLPRPGPWMDRFRRLLSVPMFLTALALAWLLGRQAGADGIVLGLGATLVVGLALWWAGRRQWAGGGQGWLPMVPALALAAAALMLLPHVAGPGQPQGGARAAPGTEAFSERRLAALLAEGRPVFVYFTADWCVTCKVNEKAVIERKAVARAFARRDVAVLVGDWTHGDATISRFLERHGRSGVPLYLVYRPGAEVRILPQVLTVDLLLEATGG